MTEDKEAFLSRWSRRKREEAEKPAQPPAAQAKDSAAPPLPPVDKLTPESDYTAFMHPKVDQALRRVALKKMFNDPHFSIPDPFEPYSGDWTGGEAISEELLKTLNQARTHLFGDDDKKEKVAEQKETAQQQTPAADAPKEDEPRRENT